MTATPPGRKRRSDAEANRHRIVASARDLFRQQGPDVPLDTIAVNAGVGNATLYRNFPDREALRTAILVERINEVDLELSECERISDPWVAFSRYARFLASEPDNTLVGVLVASPESTPDVTGYRERLRPRVRALIDRGVAAGVITAGYRLEDLNVFLYAHTKAMSDPAISGASTDRLLDHYLAGVHAGSP